MTIIFLSVAAIFGALGYRIMHERGRNGVIGFIVGLVFTLPGVLVLAIMPKTEEKKMYDIKVARERLKGFEEE